MKKRLLLTMLLFSGALFAQTTAPLPARAQAATASPRQSADLVGKWQHILVTKEAHLNQVTELKADQTFVQHAVYKAPDGTLLADNTATGHWTFDGVQLIRIVTAINNTRLKPKQQKRLQAKLESVTDSSFYFLDAKTGEKYTFNRIR